MAVSLVFRHLDTKQFKRDQIVEKFVWPLVQRFDYDKSFIALRPRNFSLVPRISPYVSVRRVDSGRKVFLGNPHDGTWMFVMWEHSQT